MKYSIAILIYGEILSTRNALTEEKYKDLADAFTQAGFNVNSVLYADAHRDKVYERLLDFDAILVWINPIEQGNDRRILDSMLKKLSDEGCFVSTHPEVILKIGTKDVLYKTKNIGWVGEVKIYLSYGDFIQRFPESLHNSGSTVLKQYRGNGGNGVFRIMTGPSEEEVTVLHAQKGAKPKVVSWTAFNDEFKSYFTRDGLLIEQEWNENLANGMVRCYLCGTKVAGFGYQEINALYQVDTGDSKISLPPGKRYYFTENCGLFGDLREVMEKGWVPQLQKIQSIPDGLMPIIWDADFFINDINSTNPEKKYSLCEINVSSVSPFPPSAIPFIVAETGKRIQLKKQE